MIRFDVWALSVIQFIDAMCDLTPDHIIYLKNGYYSLLLAVAAAAAVAADNNK